MDKINVKCDIPPRMTVSIQGEKIKIYDRINDGVIQVNYNNKDKLVKFIKDLQRDGFPNCYFGHDNTVNLSMSASRRPTVQFFTSNYIKIARLDCIIELLNGITKDKIKIMFDKSLEDKSIRELLAIKRRIANKKRYKQKDSVKYIEYWN